MRMYCNGYAFSSPFACKLPSNNCTVGVDNCSKCVNLSVLSTMLCRYCLRSHDFFSVQPLLVTVKYSFSTHCNLNRKSCHMTSTVGRLLYWSQFASHGTSGLKKYKSVHLANLQASLPQSSILDMQCSSSDFCLLVVCRFGGWWFSLLKKKLWFKSICLIKIK